MLKIIEWIAIDPFQNKLRTGFRVLLVLSVILVIHLIFIQAFLLLINVFPSVFGKLFFYQKLGETFLNALEAFLF